MHLVYFFSGVHVVRCLDIQNTQLLKTQVFGRSYIIWSHFVLFSSMLGLGNYLICSLFKIIYNSPSSFILFLFYFITIFFNFYQLLAILLPKEPFTFSNLTFAFSVKTQLFHCPQPLNTLNVIQLAQHQRSNPPLVVSLSSIFCTQGQHW